MTSHKFTPADAARLEEAWLLAPNSLSAKHHAEERNFYSIVNGMLPSLLAAYRELEAENGRLREARRHPDLWWDSNDIEFGADSAGDIADRYSLFEIVKCVTGYRGPDKWIVGLADDGLTSVFDTEAEADAAVERARAVLKEAEQND